VDTHALCHAVGTYLSKNRVLSRLAQAAMRHSSLDLTMLARRGENVYTDLSSAPRMQGYGGQAPACSTWLARWAPCQASR
jgi:hypothetical protein